ncbi:MAG: DUF2807 domain-containing protein [Pseudomonadota bacterium]
MAGWRIHKNAKALAIGLMASCAFVSAANSETKSFDFKDFDKVSVAAGINADIALAEDFSLTVDTTEEEMAQLDIRLNGRTLLIGRNFRGVSWGRRDPVKASVRLPALEGVSASSGARVEAAGIDAGAFDIAVSSGAHLNVAGACDALDIDVSSGGRAEVDAFRCTRVNAEASSGGSADVYANQAVDAEASSGGAISVEGGPSKISKETSSGGAVTIN